MAFCTVCGSQVEGAFCGKCGARIEANTGVKAPPPPPPHAAPPPPPPYAPPRVQPRRGLHPLALIALIICGAIFLVFAGVVGLGLFAAHALRQNPGGVIAKIVTAANPDIEVVNVDNGAGTLTIRNRRTGRESVITFDQARRGRWRFSADDGDGGHADLRFGGGQPVDLPAWVPKYPGSVESGNFSAKASDEHGEGEGGNFTFSTPDSPRQTLDFYREKAGQIGMRVNLDTSTGAGGTLIAASEGERRSLTVVAESRGNSTNVNVTYASKR